MIQLLGLTAGQLLRTRDAANRELRLTADQDQDVIISAMSSYPTLLQRPIGIHQGRAVLGRPVERLLELFETPT